MRQDAKVNVSHAEMGLIFNGASACKRETGGFLGPTGKLDLSTW